ncbi:MAG: xanthine dehydrogenase family protein subunit M [candidate division NC10 bacterium]|nr:xanthine dehydrogenase family protein subunit M [candidate division NC10 bacterium]
MYPATFEYHTPGSVNEAVSLLDRYKDEAKLLAGGHSLIPIMKLRLAQPKHLIDLRKIQGLSGIREAGGAIVIGALTTHWMVESSDLLKQTLPILPEAAGQIGDMQVRNMGTIGGSLAHADPAADLPAVILALGAELKAMGPKGERTTKAEDFFVDLLTTALQPNEVLTEIRIPLPLPKTGGAYEKYPHPASRYAVVGVAALLTVDRRDTVQSASIGITGIGSKATRARAAEQYLIGKAPDNDALKTAAERATEGISIRADLQGSAEYKAHLAKVYTRRALTRALERARAA